jgi:TolB protein
MTTLLVGAAIPFSLGAGAAAPAPRPAGQPTLQNGRIAFSTGFIQPDPDLSAHSQVFTVNPDGSDVHQLTHVPKGSQAGDPDWSPDSTQIAYVSNVPGTFSVMVMNADGSDKHLIASTPGWDYFQPRWSPDGTQFAVTRCNQAYGFCDLDLMNADGTGRHILVASHVLNGAADWSPDGTQIVFDSNRAGLISALWVVDAAGGGLRRLTRPAMEAFYPQWSPLGNRILFSDNSDRPNQNVFVMNPDGMRARQLTDTPGDSNAFFATYSPDGRRIVFLTDHHGFFLNTMNGNGTDVTPITTRPRVTYADWGSPTTSTDTAAR